MKLVLIFSIACAALMAQNRTTVSAAHLVDPVSGRVMQNVLVTVRGDRIESVTENSTAKAEIALPQSFTLLPGLIDSHTHLLLEPEDALTPPVLHKSQAYREVEAVGAARRTLEAGFTTVRDLDSEGAEYADVALRDGINRGIVPGPRMFVSGNALTITGGYMNLLGMNPDIPLPDPAILADTREAMIAAVRRNVKYGVDQIKIYVTGSLPQVTRPDFQPLPQMSLEDVRAVVAEASRFHKDVAAHAYGGTGARNAIEGGVRSIEHGLFLDEEAIRLMASHGVFYCPTLYVYTSEPGLDRNGADFMNGVRARHRSSFQMAMKDGVKIVFGTDAGGFDHGMNAQEFRFMVDGGMSPLEAIRSATIRPAELLRKEKDLGAVAPGYFADMIAVDGDPLRDIGAMTHVGFVMKGGVVVKNTDAAR